MHYIKKISEIKGNDYQVILATSASSDLTKVRLKDIPHNLIDLEDKVIRPII